MIDGRGGCAHTARVRPTWSTYLEHLEHRLDRGAARVWGRPAKQRKHPWIMNECVCVQADGDKEIATPLLSETSGAVSVGTSATCTTC